MSTNSVLKNFNKKPVAERGSLETKFKNSRYNLLLVVAFTLINIVLLITDTDTFFLFSAYIPYGVIDLGMLVCGKYPAEFYQQNAIAETLDPSAFIGFIIIAAIIVLLYLACWFFSKKVKTGWLVFALIIFAIDAIALIYVFGFESDNIVDIIFHVWVIVSLIMGISAGSKLKKLPPEEEETQEAFVNYTELE